MSKVTMIDFIKHNLKCKSELLVMMCVEGGFFTEAQIDGILTEIWLRHLSDIRKRGDAFIEMDEITEIIQEECPRLIKISTEQTAMIAEILKSLMRELGYSSENVGSKVVISIY